MPVFQFGNDLPQHLPEPALAAIAMRGRKDAVLIHKFKFERDPLAIAFTSDANGWSLPAGLGPWRSVWGAILPTGPGFRAFAATRAGFEAHGFYVHRAGYAA
jgi:hypothetical protein